MPGMACSSRGSETSEAVKDQTRWTRVKATRQCEAGELAIPAAHFSRDGRFPWDTNSLTNGGWACHSVLSRVPAGASIPALSSASRQTSHVDWGNLVMAGVRSVLVDRFWSVPAAVCSAAVHDQHSPHHSKALREEPGFPVFTFSSDVAGWLTRSLSDTMFPRSQQNTRCNIWGEQQH